MNTPVGMHVLDDKYKTLQSYLKKGFNFLPYCTDAMLLNSSIRRHFEENKMKNIICIIPARMGSSRFPGKPMFKIRGIPMIEMVYKKVKRNKFLKDVIVATCDREIF